MKPLLRLSLCISVIFFTGCGGCGLGGLQGTAKDITTQITQDLDQAISSLNAQSANWQNILQTAINNLPEQANATIRGELNNLLQRTVAAAGAEVRCDVDFFRSRVQQALEKIKNDLLGRPSPTPEPVFCSAVPSAVDMSLPANSRNKIDFYGYDFDKTKEQVFLVTSGGRTDVSQYLEQSTHYQMTLNLGGNGVPLDKNSQRIVLNWNNQDVSTILVIQPQPKICQTSIDNVAPNKITYIPPHVGGDAEFDGNGPHVNCSVWLSISPDGTALNANISMDAKETQSDWTEARGTGVFNIYNAVPGKIIESIVTPNNANFAYTDVNHDDDGFGGNGCVSDFVFVGDKDGDDAGITTKVTVAFNKITLQLKEKGDCVSSSLLNTLVKQNKISQALKTKIATPKANQ